MNRTRCLSLTLAQMATLQSLSAAGELFLTEYTSPAPAGYVIESASAQGEVKGDLATLELDVRPGTDRSRRQPAILTPHAESPPAVRPRR